jgi:hypothetical protein
MTDPQPGYVWIRHAHPDITQDAYVPESAVPIHRGSGWRPVEEVEAEQAAQQPEPVADAAGSSLEPTEKPARRRRNSEENG